MAATNSEPRRYRGQTAQERGLERRARLEQAALELIGERGWQQATMTEICRTAGLTERYFYESFKSRDDLYVAVIEQLGADVLRAVLSAVDPAAPPRERVRAAAGALVAFLVGDPRRGRVALVEGAGSPELERRRRQIILGLADEIAQRWEALFGVDGGALAQRALTATAIAGTVWALITRKLDGTIEICDEQLAACIADAALRLAGVPG